MSAVLTALSLAVLTVLTRLATTTNRGIIRELLLQELTDHEIDVGRISRISGAIRHALVRTLGQEPRVVVHELVSDRITELVLTGLLESESVQKTAATHYI